MSMGHDPRKNPGGFGPGGSKVTDDDVDQIWTAQDYEEEDPETFEVDMPETTAWLVAGPLGSGKTLAASLVSEELERQGELPHVEEFSNYVRYRYEGAVGGDTDDNSLGAWAAEMRKDKGRDHFAQGLAGELSGPVPMSEHVIVSGVRSPTTPPVFRQFLDNVIVIVMWALPHVRFTRVDEDSEAFDERNEREMQDWECKEFYLDEDAYDYMVPNNYNDEEALRHAIRRIVLDEYDGSRDASVFREAPWHASAGMRALQREEVRLL